MDMTGMVSISPLGSRPGAGIDLGELGLLGLIVWAGVSGGAGRGLPRSWIFPECCQVPGQQNWIIYWDNLLQPPPRSGLGTTALKGPFIPSFTRDEVGSSVLCESQGSGSFWTGTAPH